MIAENFWSPGLLMYSLFKNGSSLSDWFYTSKWENENRVSRWGTAGTVRGPLTSLLQSVNDLAVASMAFIWLLSTLSCIFHKEFFSYMINSKLCIQLLLCNFEFNQLQCLTEEAILKNIAICLGSHNEISLSLYNHLHNSF